MLTKIEMGSEFKRLNDAMSFALTLSDGSTRHDTRSDGALRQHVAVENVYLPVTIGCVV